MSEHGYMLVYSDNASDFYTFGIPNEPDSPMRVYRTPSAAKEGAVKMVAQFHKFMPVAYGEAYPYDKTSFDEELGKNGSAPYGWAVIEGEPGTPPTKVGIYVLKVQLG
jgi:hypothetical protein